MPVMKRSTFVLALTSSTIAVVVALVALVDGTGSHRSTSTVEPRRGEANQAQQTSSVDTELNESTVVVAQRANDEYKDPKRGDDQKPMVTEGPRKYSSVEEATSRELVREEVTRYVQEVYPLLISDLELTSSQQDVLLSLLIEAEIAATRTSYSSGKGMDEHERSNRIAAIIGDSKLQQFLALERYREEYAEIQKVRSMLQQKEVPLTDPQRDGLLEILVDVREQVETKPPADMNHRSIEYLQYRLDQMDEYERLVMELAPSVLSAKQVGYLFERYQALSYARAYALEVQRKARADDPMNEDLPLWYPPRN